MLNPDDLNRAELESGCSISRGGNLTPAFEARFGLWFGRSSNPNDFWFSYSSGPFWSRHEVNLIATPDGVLCEGMDGGGVKRWARTSIEGISFGTALPWKMRYGNGEGQVRLHAQGKVDIVARLYGKGIGGSAAVWGGPFRGGERKAYALAWLVASALQKPLLHYLGYGRAEFSKGSEYDRSGATNFDPDRGHADDFLSTGDRAARWVGRGLLLWMGFLFVVAALAIAYSVVARTFFRTEQAPSRMPREQVRTVFNATPDQIRIILQSQENQQNTVGFFRDPRVVQRLGNPVEMEAMSQRIDSSLCPAETLFCHSFDLRGPQGQANALAGYRIATNGEVLTVVARVRFSNGEEISLQEP